MHTASDTNADDDQLLTPDEVSQLLSIKPGTLRQWRSQGRGPTYTHVGRFVRYPRAELRAYLEAGRVTTQ